MHNASLSRATTFADSLLLERDKVRGVTAHKFLPMLLAGLVRLAVVHMRRQCDNCLENRDLAPPLAAHPRVG